MFLTMFEVVIYLMSNHILIILWRTAGDNFRNTEWFDTNRYGATLMVRLLFSLLIFSLLVVDGKMIWLLGQLRSTTIIPQ